MTIEMLPRYLLRFAILLPIITFHEYAHGWVALRLGDETASANGRLTLNPLHHIDPVGTVILPLILIVTNAGFLFGWAKPVPVNPYNFDNPRKGMMLVALAGPVSTIVLGLALAMILKLNVFGPGTVGEWLFMDGIMICLYLTAFNILPIPPLDGSQVVSGLLEGRAAEVYASLEPYGKFVILGLLVTRTLGYILYPMVRILMKLFVFL